MKTVPANIGGKYDINIPVRFDKFEFVRVIGSGSLSIVALVVSNDNKYYACKICSRQLLMENNAFEMFEREIRILQSLSHPYLVHLEKVVFDDQLIYQIMEYCEQGELFQYIVDNGPLPIDTARLMFIKLTFALQYIHSKDIAHRDLKPENILLDRDLNPKIADFGLCHTANSKQLLSTPCGSPFYAPPEIISNIPYDGKLSDMWSLGVVLFTMVTGSLPWKSSNQTALYRQIIEAQYYIPPKLPVNLRDLIEHLMVAEPRERLSTTQVLMHPWVQESEHMALLNNYFSSGAHCPSDTFISKSKRKNSENSVGKKPLIVRPTIPKVQQSFSAKASMNPALSSIIRKVPTSGKAHKY